MSFLYILKNGHIYIVADHSSNLRLRLYHLAMPILLLHARLFFCHKELNVYFQFMC